jgi:Phosphatidylinositol N-acetylglucosaminyltransferase
VTVPALHINLDFCGQTLTRTTSSDTILALAIAMLLAHLFLHDYRLQVSLTSTASGAASLAAAIFASVVIASRLSSQLHVFSQVLISLQTTIHVCTSTISAGSHLPLAKLSDLLGTGVAQPGGVPHAAISAAFAAPTGLDCSRCGVQLGVLRPAVIVAKHPAWVHYRNSFRDFPVSLLARGHATALCKCFRPVGCCRCDQH